MSLSESCASVLGMARTYRSAKVWASGRGAEADCLVTKPAGKSQPATSTSLSASLWRLLKDKGSEMKLPVAILTVLLLEALGVSNPACAQSTDAPPDQAFFERDVLPILKANCFACHGAENKLQGGLRLTSRDEILKGGESGPAVDPKNVADSLLVQAINYDGLMMPPKGKLAKAQIDTLTEWVRRGLPWSEQAVAAALKKHGAPAVDAEARSFWAFRPVSRPAIPQVANADWVRTPVDAFVLANLEAKHVKPARPADKATLLRRLHYTLTGLPPSPREVESFVNDSAADAYERRVEALLDSRHYGEHWGRHWLDLVRYAETNSFERDNPKPMAWKYRDYVIQSFNDDKPYDQFIREQLAGDELDEVTPESIIATGYYRLGLWDDEPADPLLAYYDGLDDIIATTTQTFLGLTGNCARCHDHKIDPFTQRDYYSLLAFFHGIRHYGNRSDASVAENSLRFVGTAADRERQAEAVAAWEARLAEFSRQIATLENSVKDKLSGGEIDDFKFERQRPAILRRHRGTLISEEDFARYEQLRKERMDLERQRPKVMEQALCVTEDPRPRETFLLLRGNPQSRGDRVEPAFPAVLVPEGKSTPQIVPRTGDTTSSGRRRVLADWIASAENPLTARVMVNRVWQYHFGRGLVRTSSNFGYQGTPPTHPELLDWLASEFVANGWKLKPLHRILVLSNSFRMSSESKPSDADPENDWLSHFDLRRLSAEEVRDSILAVSGNLNLNKRNGPSVYPVIPPEVLAGQSRPGAGWGKSSPEDSVARSVFVHVKRSLSVPLLAVFDSPDTDAPCAVRFTTTQPSQALALINSTFAHEQAAIFARSLRAEAGDNLAACVRTGLYRVWQRSPTDNEVARGVRFIEDNVAKEQVSADEALRRFCLLAINLNEFLFLN
jgi:mono/diheme cytochrome c family protein